MRQCSIFLEKTTLTFLMQVLHTDAILVKIQLLQTLSILIQNLKSEMALCMYKSIMLIFTILSGTDFLPCSLFTFQQLHQRPYHL